MRMGFITLECECDGVSVSAKWWNEYDSVVLGDSSLCRFESCFLRVGSVDDNGVTKLRKVVSHGGVQRDFALLD